MSSTGSAHLKGPSSGAQCFSIVVVYHDELVARLNYHVPRRVEQHLGGVVLPEGPDPTVAVIIRVVTSHTSFIIANAMKVTLRLPLAVEAQRHGIGQHHGRVSEGPTHQLRGTSPNADLVALPLGPVEEPMQHLRQPWAHACSRWNITRRRHTGNFEGTCRTGLVIVLNHEVPCNVGPRLAAGKTRHQINSKRRVDRGWRKRTTGTTFPSTPARALLITGRLSFSLISSTMGARMSRERSAMHRCRTAASGGSAG